MYLSSQTGVWDAEVCKITRHAVISPTEHRYTALAPANLNIAPKGMYMLFAVLPKSESASGKTEIPSVAKFVSLS